MQLSTVTTEKEFARLQQDWHILLANSNANKLFSSWELAHTFWQVYGGGAQLRIVCVHHNNQLIAIFPLYIRTSPMMKLFTLRQLLWLGSGGDTSPDYLGGIVHQDYDELHESLLGKAIDQLCAQWDVCCLVDMQRHIERERMCREIDCRLLYGRLDTREIICAQLAPDWDEYLAMLSSNRRQQIRRARRKVFEQEGAELVRLSSSADLDVWFSELVRLHHKRWQQKGEQEHAFRSDHYNSFHRQFMASMLERNALRLWGLKKGEAMIAVLYCLSDGDTTWYYQGGFDTDYDQLKPGMVLMSCAMEEAIKEGCQRFNMLKGDYDFKRSLAKGNDTTWSVTLARPSLAGYAWTLRYVLVPALKNAISK